MISQKFVTLSQMSSLKKRTYLQEPQSPGGYEAAKIYLIKIDKQRQTKTS